MRSSYTVSEGKGGKGMFSVVLFILWHILITSYLIKFAVGVSISMHFIYFVTLKL